MMKSDLTRRLTDRFEGKNFPFDQNRFCLNIQTDKGATIGISTKSGSASVQSENIDGATVLHITDDLMERVLDGSADLQGLYLNRYVQVDGSVMDVMHFRDAV